MPRRKWAYNKHPTGYVETRARKIKRPVYIGGDPIRI
jgi:hypothetical protein